MEFSRTTTCVMVRPNHSAKKQVTVGFGKSHFLSLIPIITNVISVYCLSIKKNKGAQMVHYLANADALGPCHFNNYHGWRRGTATATSMGPGSKLVGWSCDTDASYAYT